MNEEHTPALFISYSHDNEQHKAWVLQLATRIRSNDVDVILDRWDLRLGKNLPNFMERGLSASSRVLCICSEAYVNKANAGKGGTGYEKTIITATLLEDVNSNWVIPVIKNNHTANKVPTFLKGRMFIDFSDPKDYETKYEELLREIHGEQVLPLPPIGPNPFKVIGAFGHKRFVPSSEKYLSPSLTGNVIFDFSNNNGSYTIGQGKLLFETKWTRADITQIHAYSNAESIISVAHAKGVGKIEQIEDASKFDTSSRVRTIPCGHIAIFQNANGYYAAVSVISIKVADLHLTNDELIFEYIIQSNGSPDFSSHGIVV